MKTLWLSLLAMIIFSAGCGGAPAASPTPTPNPLALVTQAASSIRDAASFRLDVSQTGPDYSIGTVYAPVIFRRASAQYIAPGTMQASVRVLAAGLPVDVDVFARGPQQCYRAIWTGNSWLNEPFAPGFDPQSLIAEETGFQAALDALVDVRFVGEEALENGARVLHISGSADGSRVTALLVGLIAPQGTVGVDLFTDAQTGYPARFTLTETVVDEFGVRQPEPRVWTIDVSDINAAGTLPEADGCEVAAPEATAAP